MGCGLMCGGITLKKDLQLKNTGLDNCFIVGQIKTYFEKFDQCWFAEIQKDLPGVWLLPNQLVSGCEDKVF